MAKNFATIYSGGNNASALEQRVFLKEEVTRGTMVAPAGTDFIYQLAGGGIKYERPASSSPIRSGRHNTTVIQEKDKTTWSFPTYFMIDTSLGAAGVAEIDPGMRTLWKSLLGREQTAPHLTYDAATAPSITFSLFVNGDLYAMQAPGCFVQGANLTFPGDGRSQAEWNGSAKTMYRIGIGKSITPNAANIITLGAGEGKNFEVGGMVMVILADGVTRSADTPTGSPRTITAIDGDDVTVDGAVLADADGSGASAPVYLCYYEPETPAAINDPQTGLQGTITIGGLTTGNVRSAGINITNNHEEHNYYWGQRGLGGPLFTPGGRLNVEVSMELNMSQELLGWTNGLKDFTGEAITLSIGDTASRYGKVTLPKVIFGIPEITTPETGSVPVTFQGLAYQSAEDAADEITVEFP